MDDAFVPDPRFDWAALLQEYLEGTCVDPTAMPPGTSTTTPTTTTTTTAAADETAVTPALSSTDAAYQTLTAGLVDRSFAAPEVEREYQRFVHGAMHGPDALLLLVYAIRAAVDAAASGRPSGVGSLTTLAECAVWTLTALVSAIAFVALRRSLERASTATERIEALQRSATARRIIATIGTTAATTLHLLAGSQAPQHCHRYAHPDVSDYDACVNRPPYGTSGNFVLMALLIRHTGALSACFLSAGVVWVALELTVFAANFENVPGDTARRFASLCAIVVFFFLPMSVARDRGSRQHFIAILLSSAADARARAAHLQTGAVVAALLPAAVAARLQHHCGRGDVGTDATHQLTPLLATLYREAAVATVCITEAADMAAFERKQASTRRVVHGMCHLFTLFDIGAAVFGVERAGCFGDSFTVAAGLEGRDNSDVLSPGQRALDVCRFALWQLGLDEVVTLPLRACVVTGALRGAVLSDAAGQHVRYHVSGPALALAATTVGGVPAQHVWACHETHRLTREARAELTRIRMSGSASMRSSTLGCSSLSIPVAGDSTSEVVVNPCGGDSGPPSFEDLSIADAGVRLAGAAGDSPRTPSSASQHQTLPIVRVEWTPAGSVPPPDPANTDDPYLDALVFATRDDRRLRLQQRLHSSTVECPAVAVAAAADTRGSGSTHAADEDASAREEPVAYQPHPREILPGAALVALCVVLCALVSLLSPYLGFSADHRSAGGSPIGVFVLLALALVSAVLAGALGAVAAKRFERHGYLRALPYSAAAKLALALAVTCTSTSVWFMAPNPVRNDPGPLATIMLPIMARVVVDALPPAVAAAVANVCAAVPGMTVFVVRDADDPGAMAANVGRLSFLVVVMAVFTRYIQRETQAQFEAKHQAERRAAASSYQLSRLRALVQGMIPAHAIARAVEESGIEALRQRVTTMPGGVTEEHEDHYNSSDDATSTADADREKLHALARTIKSDFGTVAVDEYNACLIICVILPTASSPSSAADSDDTLTAAWGDVCAAVDAANAAYEEDIADVVDFSNDHQQQQAWGTPNASAVGVDAFPAVSVVDATAATAPAPTPAAPTAERSAAGGGDALISIATRIAERRPLPLRILEQRGDRVVIGGPLVRRTVLRPDGTAAAPHAMVYALGAAVRLMRSLSEAVPGVACGATVGDAAGAVLGCGTLRYGVYGVLKHHAAELAEAAAATAAIAPRDTTRVSVAAVSQGFAAMLAGNGGAREDDWYVADFVASLSQARHPSAFRTLGRSRPLFWSSSNANACLKR